jgi:hypothetical protein
MSTTSELAPRRSVGNESELASTGALAFSARNGELGARSFFNRALWGKALFECRGLLLASLALMFSFHWIFVWITSMVQLGPLADFVKTLPNGIQNLSGVPVNELATVAGRIALAYVDPVVLFTAAVWGISRGSDAVAGEIDRGTMEMLLAQPIDRLALLLTKGAVAVLGAALIAVVSFAGTWCGLTGVSAGGHQLVRDDVFLGGGELCGIELRSLSLAGDWAVGRLLHAEPDRERDGPDGGKARLAGVLHLFRRL